MPPTPPPPPLPSLLWTQLLTPLLTAGLLTAEHVCAALRLAVHSGSVGALAANLIKAALESPVAAVKVATEVALKGARTPALGLVLPAKMSLRKTVTASAAVSAAVPGAFADLDAFKPFSPLIQNLAGAEGDELVDASDALVAAVHAAPETGRQRPDFARALAAEAVHAALQNAGGDMAAAQAVVVRFASAIRSAAEYAATAADSEGEEAVATNLLNGVVVAITANDELEDPAAAYTAAFKALGSTGEGGSPPAVAVAGFKAWLEALPYDAVAAAFNETAVSGPAASLFAAAQPFGRDAAVAATQAWIAGL
jgi:hypothetical protein